MDKKNIIIGILAILVIAGFTQQALGQVVRPPIQDRQKIAVPIAIGGNTVSVKPIDTATYMNAHPNASLVGISGQLILKEIQRPRLTTSINNFNHQMARLIETQDSDQIDDVTAYIASVLPEEQTIQPILPTPVQVANLTG